MSTVYARVLGEAGLEALSPECRALHASHGAFDGVIDVETTTNPLFRFALRVFGFPYKPGQASVIFSNTAKGDVDNWQRQMGDHRMSSMLSEKDGWLHESLGGLTVLCRMETRVGGHDLIVSGFLVFRCRFGPVQKSVRANDPKRAGTALISRSRHPGAENLSDTAVF